MDLIFFDLDGTLLNSQSQISDFTRETLALLRKNDIAYTVATGRTMLSASAIIAEHSFLLPHIYNNGVTVFNPQDNSLKLEKLEIPLALAATKNKIRNSSIRLLFRFGGQFIFFKAGWLLTNMSASFSPYLIFVFLTLIFAPILFKISI